MSKLMKILQEPLGLDHVDFMPKTLVGKDKKYAMILPYKDARVDMKRLDEATDGLWQNKYERDSKGVLQCGIGIKIDDEWVWKWSNGVPSQSEAVKGEYSDALKRAGFMWGIGRELYEYPKIFVELKTEEWYEGQGQAKLSASFKPQEWRWDRDGKNLKAKDKRGHLRVNVDIHAMEKPLEEAEVGEAVKTDKAQKPMTEAQQMAEIRKIITEHKVDEQIIMQSYGVKSLQEIDSLNRHDLLTKLKAKYEGSN